MLRKTLFFVLLLASVSLAATVHGIIYEWSTLEPLEDSIVYVNSTPAQQLVSRDGNYSFELPMGNYEIVARYYENNSLALETTESITIGTEGRYLLDLIMFPALDLGEPLFNETWPDLDEQYLYSRQDDWSSIIFLSVILAAVILFFAVKIGLKSRVEQRQETQEERPKRLSKEARQVLEIIQKEQRTTQKELRKKLPWSEAKVSLIVADLEERGLIKKIKKGRGNILKID